jgi:hypothetical protein
MVQRQNGDGIGKRMMIPGPRTQTVRYGENWQRPAWHIFRDIDDERADYVNKPAELLIGEAPTFDTPSQQQPMQVDLLLHAQVKMKKKKGKSGLDYLDLANMLNAIPVKASVRTQPKAKGCALASHDENAQSSPAPADALADAGTDSEFDMDIDFDMFSDLSEMLELEEDGWEYLDSAPKMVRFADDRPAYALVVKAGR